MERQKEIHDKAWDLLEQKGLKMGEKMMVRSAFVEWSGYKNENPFIDKKYKKGNIEYYHSTHKDIDSLMFSNENEVVLANAIYLNSYHNQVLKFNQNEFVQNLKYCFRIIGLGSDWA